MKYHRISKAIALLILLAVGAAAQVEKKRDPNPKINDVKVCGADIYPDLTIINAEVPKSDDILVTVKSIGECDAAPSELTMKITFVDPASTHGGYYTTVAVPLLRSGQSKQLKLRWTSGVWGMLADRQIRLKFVADASFRIREEDEYNNAFTLNP